MDSVEFAYHFSPSIYDVQACTSVAESVVNISQYQEIPQGGSVSSVAGSLVTLKPTEEEVCYTSCSMEDAKWDVSGDD